jgi:predicted nuclease with RNAse H fold
MYVGIDLTSSPARPSAVVCLTTDLEPVLVDFLHSDSEIITTAEKFHSGLIAIDAPLGLPLGLCCLNKACSCQPRAVGKGRACERELAQMGIPCYFTTKRSIIKDMVYRAIFLRQALESCGQQVIEVYPYATKICLWGRPVPPKHRPEGLLWLKERLAGILPGLRPCLSCFNHDLCDAALAAYTAFLCYSGQTQALGCPEEGLLHIPGYCIFPQNVLY